MASNTPKNGGQKRETEQALAALAASPSRLRGECPTSETMAAVVEGACSSEERRFLLGHIALCSSCYQEWLDLRSERLGRQKPSRAGAVLQRLVSPRKLAYIGSALSVAAVVAVFVNIRMESTPMEKAGVELFSPALERQTVPPAASRGPDLDSQRTSGPPLKKSGEPPELQRRKEEPGSAEQETAEHPLKIDPDFRRQAEADTETRTAASREKSAREALFRSMLQGCRQGEADREFWLQRQKRLGMIPAAEDKDALAELLQLAANMADSGQPGRYCPAILAILERLGYY